MKKFTLDSFLDQRKPLSHFLYILITLAAVLFISVRNGNAMSFSDKLNFFLLGMIQLEVFIFIARKIFKEMDAKVTGREFTKVVLSRFFLFMIICFFAALVIILVFDYLFALIKDGDMSTVLSDFFENEFSTWFKSTLGGLSLGAIIFIIIQWQDALKREQKLREENLVFQNETLKSQVNPHFLFNSLNTLLSLIRSEPGLSEKFVQKLSSIYRYTLENREKELVPLSEELDFVNDYFYLQKIRDDEKIEMKTELNISNNGLIVPVSLQLLVENALKHNTSTRKQPLKIIIHNEGIDKLVVRNVLQKKTQLEDSSKIGLKNLNERCRLIMNREIEILETADEFIVKIPVKVN